MEYIEIKQKFYSSEYATQIADNWVNGIPFFIIRNERAYDGFLFYSIDRKNSTFHSVKMLAFADMLTSEIGVEENIEDLNIEKGFTFEPKRIDDIEEYFKILDELEGAYIQLRNIYISTKCIDKEAQKRYLEQVFKIIPQEITKNVYFFLAPMIFSSKEQ